MSRTAETMRPPALLALALAVALAGCGKLDQEAMVLTAAPGWTAEIAAGEKDGFGSNDGVHGFRPSPE